MEEVLSLEKWRDCLIAHGAANTITEVLKDSEEDYQDVYVCENCGDIAAQIKGINTCLRCSKLNLSPLLTKLIPRTYLKYFLLK